MTSATEELRRLLDERGVAHSDHYLSTTWRDGHGILHLAGEPMADGSLVVDMLTPEQAIAATLGGGALTAEQVSKAVYAHSIHADCADADWQAIADELNARAERTCELIDNGTWGYPYGCSECGASFDADVNNGDFNFCPNCGSRVVG